MATFVVAHGAWSAGFVWKKMHPLLRAGGHELFTPTYTGLGERRHLLKPDIGLETHVQDVIEHIFHEDLKDVYLIGHSYGGITATGVADLFAERLKHVIYLDAFIPNDGQNMMDCATPEARVRWQEGAQQAGDGWRVPPNPLPPDTTAEDVAWIKPRRHDHPLKAMTQPLKLVHGETKLPRSYIYCKRIAPGDMFGPYAKRARNDKSWGYYEMDASHSPHITASAELAVILNRIATG